jgi:splicing factor 3B subunit 3
MYLYHLTALPPGGANHVAYGSFSAARKQEVVLASGSSLQLFRLSKVGQLESVARADAFATVRAIAPFRLVGSRQDFLLVTSDAGTLSLLSFSASTRSFTRARCEVFGKSGCRRAVPGQFLAADPKGRACMVGALERSKFAYILTRDVSELITIRSPLEAHKSGVATHALVALDVGFANPMFAALERPYEESDGPKLLVYYELDLGLNHVVRRYASPVDALSYVLLPVPGGTDGPGGVLVCSPGKVSYRNLVEEQEAADAATEEATASPRIEALMPHRSDADKLSPSMIVCGAFHRLKDVFFFMLCTDQGDLLKAELDWSEADSAIELRLIYFDTLPAPAHALAIFRSGYLFAALETGDPLFLKFNVTKRSDDDMTGGISVARKVGTRSVLPNDSSLGDINEDPDSTLRNQLPFYPREKMMYFTLVDVIESLAPGLAIACGDFCGEGSSQLVCSGGRGKQATLRVLRRGFAILELMTQNMPGSILSCFTLRESMQDIYDRYIVVCFAEHTKVLRISENTVSESSDAGLLTDVKTILAAQIGESSLLQVYDRGVRYVPDGQPSRATEWNPPADSMILSAAANSAQVVVALSTGDLVYFEHKPGPNEGLTEIERIPDAISAAGGGAVDSATIFSTQRIPLALPDVPPGRKKASFLALSDGVSNIVRIFQLDNDNEFKSASVHMAPAPVDSLAIVDFSEGGGDDSSSASMLSLLVGTRKGALITLRIDPMSGALSNRRSHFLGPRVVRVHTLKLGGVSTCVALSIRPWLLHKQGARLAMSPLCTETMDWVTAFSSEQNPDGFVGVSGAMLRFLSLESVGALSASSSLPSRLPASWVPSEVALGSTFFMSKSRLTCTPRRIVPVPQLTTDKVGTGQGSSNEANPILERRGEKEGLFAILETEHRSKFRQPVSRDDASPMKTDIEMKELQLSEALPGDWASQVRLVSVKSEDQLEEGTTEDELDQNTDISPFADLYAKAGKTLDIFPFVDDDASALCATCSNLGSSSAEETYVVVSVARRLVVTATSPCSETARSGSGPSGELHVFRVNLTSKKLEPLQVTPVELPVYSLAAFRDKLLVGIGTSLRLYELGKRQLLRKAECRMVVANQICAIAVAGGDRVFVGDVQDSVTLVKYYAPPSATSNSRDFGGRQEGGRFVPIAHDGIPRCILTLLTLDYSTVCATDKFGNLFVLRFPPELSGVAEESSIGFTGVTSQDISHRLATEASIHIGSSVTSLARGTLRGGIGLESTARESSDSDAIIYCTIGGAIGILAPFTVKSDIDFATSLEREMRERNLSLVGRSHVSYRSSFYPVKHIVDGDLCEMFLSLSPDDQIAAADRLERELSDILRKLDDLRANIL